MVQIIPLLLNHEVILLQEVQCASTANKGLILKEVIPNNATSLSYSVREKEIDFYRSINDWWSPSGPQGQLHKFNMVRVNFIRKHLQQALQSTQQGKGEEQFKTLKALDVGCGAGILSESLARLGFGSVTGIDPTDKCIELAQAHLDQYSPQLKSRVDYRNTTLEALVQEKSTTIHSESAVEATRHEGEPQGELFDLVCCSEVVEHVANQAQFLQNCMKLVKPGTGYLFVSTMAKTPEAYFLTIVGTHEWDQYINCEDVESILAQVGGNRVARAGVMVSNPLTMEMAEFPNWLRGNYMLMMKRGL